MNMKGERKYQMAKKTTNHTKQNYFTFQFQNLGEGWTGKISTLDVRKNAQRLFKDIACGNINLDKDIQFFNEPSFTHNLLLAASDNAYYNYTLWYSLSVLQYKDAVQDKICEEHRIRYDAYTLLANHLNTILTGITINGGLQTRDFVSSMMVALHKYRYVFNGYYITIGHPDDGKLRVERKRKYNDKGSNYRSQGPVQGFPNPDSV